jgi:biotin transporter BioY
MTPFFIAFIMSAGVAAWVYDKTQQRTGNNTSSSITIAAVVAVMVFIISLTLLAYIDNFLES